jgi:nicotinamidase-related amidase
MKAALLVIDMQNECYEECKCKDAFNESMETINAAARLFREKGLPVVMVQDTRVAQGPGSAGFNVVQGIVQDEKDISLYKGYRNAFWKTDLEGILREQGVGFVVVSGFAAEYCVLFTYNGAIERGFKVSILQNGVGAYGAEEIGRMQLLRPVVSLEALEALL